MLTYVSRAFLEPGTLTMASRAARREMQTEQVRDLHSCRITKLNLILILLPAVLPL